MIRAVLFDLDGTLLDIDFDGLVRDYLALLARHLHPLVPADQVPGHVLAAKAEMMRNADPARDNLSVFWSHFCAATGCPLARVEPAFERFYEERFGELAGHARPFPEARPLVEWVLAEGYEVAIATQPVFPLAAIRHRLAWAGLDDIPFRLITTCEVMHACKPSPGYYREIADTLGLSPEECLMVGDDAAMDLPAAAVGMQTYYVGPPDQGAGADHCGPLAGVRALLAARR